MSLSSPNARIYLKLNLMEISPQLADMREKFKKNDPKSINYDDENMKIIN